MGEIRGEEETQKKRKVEKSGISKETSDKIHEARPFRELCNDEVQKRFGRGMKEACKMRRRGTEEAGKRLRRLKCRRGEKGMEETRKRHRRGIEEVRER